MTATKTDLKRELSDCYIATATPRIVDVPEMGFLMVDGTGAAGGPAFQEAIGALYSVAYAAKFALKATGWDHVVMPLEGLWVWPEGVPAESAKIEDATWTLQMAEPEEVTSEVFYEALAASWKKRPNPALDRLRLERFHEGEAAQILHTGPYDAEQPTIARLHAFLEEEGYDARGAHHEIYLSDPLRTSPERLKTIIRRPVIPRSPR